MKKLLIIAAVAMAAFATQAAAFSWKTSLSGKVYTPGAAETLLTSGTAYLFTSTVDTSAILSAFAAGSLDLASMDSLSNKAISSGAIATTNFSDGTAVNDTLSAIFVATATVGDVDYLYISNVASAKALEGKTASLQFNEKTSSQLAVMQADGGFQGAGWYQAVPEPTSGLLMLLGMAGLALRRRRA